MRVILFQDRFAALVKAGTKTQTIRKTARCKVGDVLSLRRWTGKPYRSKQEVLREAVRVRVSRVLMREHGIAIRNAVFPDIKNCANDQARRDGFKDFGEMVLWFGTTHGLPFEGVCIEWEAKKENGNECLG